MRALVVAQAGYQAGLGHLHRMRPLLAELDRAGTPADLWVHGDASAMEGKTWPVAHVCTTDGAQSIVDVRAKIAAHASREGYDWLVVDGYDFDGSELYAELTGGRRKLAIIDDIPVRELDADVIMNANTTSAEAYAGSRMRARRLLLGPRYALLDEKPSAAVSEREFGELRTVVVTFGGVDRYGRTERVLELLNHHAPGLTITVLAGQYHPFIDALRAFSSRHALTLLRHVADPRPLFAGADLVITGAGTTAWQVCRAGAPMIAIQMVENQRLALDTLRRESAALCLDASAAPATAEAGVDAAAFDELFRQARRPDMRRNLSARAAALVDGLGASRVASSLAYSAV